MLKKYMTPEPIASPEAIGLCMPQESEEFQLTVWIYNFEEQRNINGFPGFSQDVSDLTVERFAPMQLKLFLLVTAHSKAPAQIKSADEYRILGRAMQLIRDNPELKPEFIEGSLLDEGATLNFEMHNISSEELVRIWNNSTKPVKMSFGLTVLMNMESSRTRAVSARVSDALIELDQK